MLRHQLPVHSPVPWRGVGAGLRALVFSDSRQEARVEALLRARYGALDVLLVDSGTSALRLAIAGALADAAGPVALPAYGCYDLATAAEGADASVVLYDLHPSTLGPDLESLRRIGAHGPAAVVLAYLFGQPIDIAAVTETLGDVVLIEDAAQGAGGRWDGRPLGSFGSLSVLSFGRGKGVTGGGGGALLAHDERGLAALGSARRTLGASVGRGWRQIAALTGQRALGRPALYGLPARLPFLHLGETRYRPPSTPAAAPPAALAALELAFPAADAEALVRGENAARLLRSLGASPRVAPIGPVVGASGYLRLPALLRDTTHRELEPESGRLGIMAGYPTTLDALPSLRERLAVTGRPFVGAARLARSLVTLPTHGLLTPRDLDRIERWGAGR